MAVLTERFEQAMVFAARLHAKQKRKTSGAPYVAHLLGVAALVLEDGGNEDQAIAALLHDSLEDQSYNYPGGAPALARDIGERFGPEVLRLVEALTERRGAGEQGVEGKRERWRAHKRAYIEQIRDADPAVRRISCADSLYNVRTLASDYRRLGDEVWTRFLTRNGEDQVWAYGQVAKAMIAADAGPLAYELDRAVDELAAATRIPREP